MIIGGAYQGKSSYAEKQFPDVKWKCGAELTEEELLEATKAYAQECKDRRTAEQYIKSPKTFFGPNAPFTDYLKGDEKTGDEPEYEIAADYYRKWGYRGPGDEN